jgi:CRISPR-associated protein Csm1
MLIAGELAGIQRYLFDVAHEGGGQARSLRARSFFMQLLVEVFAERTLAAVGWQERLFCNAGKFLLRGESLNEVQQAAFARVQQECNVWLRQETNAALRFTLVAYGGAATDEQNFLQLTRQMLRRKKQSWVSASGWEELILESLRNPCALCGRREATRLDDDDGIEREICERCWADYEIGKQLPTAKFVALSAQTTTQSFLVGGWHASLSQQLPPTNDIIFSLDGKAAAGATPRRLARHIPTENNRPIKFVELAQRAQGDELLGLLKMDGDRLGTHITQLLQRAQGLQAMQKFSEEMDQFFAAALMNSMQQAPWNLLYTVFSGGDDVLLLGPWNVVFDFAALIQQKFHSQFKARGLTLSGAFCLCKPKRPLHLAAEQAEKLLEKAKEQAAPGANAGRDQFAAFGQVWKWQYHSIIAQQAKQLATWVRQDVLPRGWLQTLLRLAEMRETSPLATSKLAYTVARNYPKTNDSQAEKAALRRWANALIADFDQAQDIETQYLAASVRYALTATRNVSQEETA